MSAVAERLRVWSEWSGKSEARSKAEGLRLHCTHQSRRASATLHTPKPKGFGYDTRCLLLLILECSCDKVGEKRMGRIGLRLKLWVELHADKPRMFRNLDNFDKIALGVDSRDA